MEQYTYREQFELEDEHWWFQGRRAVIWSLLERAGLRDRLRVLDAGCGTGRNLLEFGTPGSAAGVDFSPEAVQFCRLRGLDGVQVAEVEALPFADASFDLVLATDVLEHVQDDLVALRELRRVASSRGPPARHRPGLPLAVEPARSRLPPLPSVYVATASRAGPALRLGARRWSYFNSFLLPPIAAVRVLARRRRPTTDVPISV